MYELITSLELSDPVHGLQKAKPVWITVEDTRGEGIKRRGVMVGGGGGGKGFDPDIVGEHGIAKASSSPNGGNSSVVSL